MRMSESAPWTRVVQKLRDLHSFLLAEQLFRSEAIAVDDSAVGAMRQQERRHVDRIVVVRGQSEKRRETELEMPDILECRIRREQFTQPAFHAEIGQIVHVA